MFRPFSRVRFRLSRAGRAIRAVPWINSPIAERSVVPELRGYPKSRHQQGPEMQGT